MAPKPLRSRPFLIFESLGLNEQLFAAIDHLASEVGNVLDSPVLWTYVSGGPTDYLMSLDLKESQFSRSLSKRNESADGSFQLASMGVP